MGPFNGESTMTTTRFSLVKTLLLCCLSVTIFSQTAGASQSKAQIYLPWPMLNTKLNKVLSGSSSNFSTYVPSDTVNADGIIWSLTNINYIASAPGAVSHVSATQADFQSDKARLQVQIEKL